MCESIYTAGAALRAGHGDNLCGDQPGSDACDSDDRLTYTGAASHHSPMWLGWVHIFLEQSGVWMDRALLVFG